MVVFLAVSTCLVTLGIWEAKITKNHHKNLFIKQVKLSFISHISTQYESTTELHFFIFIYYEINLAHVLNIQWCRTWMHKISNLLSIFYQFIINWLTINYLVSGLSAQDNMAVRQHEQSCFYDQIVWYQPLFGLQVTTGQVKWCGRNMALETQSLFENIMDINTWFLDPLILISEFGISFAHASVRGHST